MASKNLQALINEAGAAFAGDLQPLAANETYRRAVDAELLLLNTRLDAANKAAAADDDLRGVVALFVGATAAVRRVAVRFPETNVFVAEALKQLQLAMGAVANNPQPATPAPATVGGTTAPVFKPITPTK